ncbi:low temperature requirement protein A [Micromonospora aurantiaca]|uniref:low temperature requirement protein A n=1 Tax=Micromonospora aurantiaca (nom. illeg.) TaxID=47850 RepID=UPI0033AFF973
MTEQRGGALLRTASSPGRATFLELFFDLVFVFALTRVSQRLISGLDGSAGAVAADVGRTLLLFLVLWQVWTITTWVTSRYEPERTVIQVVVVGTMFGSLVLGVTLPRALEERALPFALAYVVVMVGRPLLILVALRAHPRRLVPLRLAAWAGFSAPLWIAGALMPGPRLALWVVALAVDHLGTILGWPLPWIGASRIRQWLVAGEHLAERYQQIFLIALGESILVIGVTFSGKEFSGDAAVAFAISFVITALLWRIYFYRAGHLLAEALRVAGTPGRLAESAAQTHLFMVLGVIGAAVGYELVITHPYDTAWPGWWCWCCSCPRWRPCRRCSRSVRWQSCWRSSRSPTPAGPGTGRRRPPPRRSGGRRSARPAPRRERSGCGRAGQRRQRAAHVGQRDGGGVVQVGQAGLDPLPHQRGHADAARVGGGADPLVRLQRKPDRPADHRHVGVGGGQLRR